MSYEDEVGVETPPQPEPQPEPQSEPEPAPAPEPAPEPEPEQPGQDVEIAVPNPEKVRLVGPEPYVEEPTKERKARVELA
jgi:hypothetical protein